MKPLINRKYFVIKEFKSFQFTCVFSSLCSCTTHFTVHVYLVLEIEQYIDLLPYRDTLRQ